MTVSINYTDVPGMADRVNVSIIANNARGICRLEARGIGQTRDLFMTLDLACAPTAEWSGDVPRDEVRAGINAFASLCPDASMVPDLADRFRDCRMGLGGRDPGSIGPPPPAMPIPVTGPRVCPTPSMGSCAQDRLCEDALELVRRQVRLAEGLCSRIRERERDIERLIGATYALLAVAIALAIVGAIVNFFAPGVGAALFVAALAVFAVVAVMINVANALREELSGLRRDLSDIRETHTQTLANARGVCLCPGCGVPRSDDQDLLTC
jgi:hypothetical protein